jgi:hypothetical protein
MFIPVIPVIHRPGTRFRALYDSGSVPMSSCRREAAFPETERRSQGRPRGRAAEVRKNGKPSQAGSGQPEGRSARQRRKPRPNPLSFEGPAEPEAFGRKEPQRASKKLASSKSDREPEFGAARPRRKEPAREPKPAARRGAGPAGTGTGPAMAPRRNLRDRPGPQGLGRNLPGKASRAFGQDERT